MFDLHNLTSNRTSSPTKPSPMNFGLKLSWQGFCSQESGEKSRRWKVEGGEKLKWWKAERNQEGGSAEAVFLSFDGQCSAVGGLTWNAVLNIS